MVHLHTLHLYNGARAADINVDVPDIVVYQYPYELFLLIMLPLFCVIKNDLYLHTWL